MIGPTSSRERDDLSPLAPNNRNVGAIILAAGLGTRMGRLKQVLPIAGEPLVRRVARIALSADLGPIWVVTGHGADEVEAALKDLSPAVRFVHNALYMEGQAGSLRAGVQAAATDPNIDAAALLLGDQPYVRQETLVRLSKRVFTPGKQAAAVLYGPGLPGPPCVFHRKLWGDIVEASGDQGARATLRRLGKRLVIVPTDATELRDIDTPADVPSDIF